MRDKGRRTVRVVTSTRTQLPTHTDQGPVVVKDDSVTLERMAAPSHHRCNLVVKRIGKADMADQASLEECPRTDALGSVDDLRRNDKVLRLDVLAQTADGGEGDDGADPERSQGSDVGAVGNLVRRHLVMQAVSRQERDGHLLTGRRRRVMEDHDGRRRRAPRRCHVEGCHLLEAGQLLEAGPTDDGDADRICQWPTASAIQTDGRGLLKQLVTVGSVRTESRRGTAGCAN